ncbi:hypothetical protein MXD59_21665 [Frankia sp. Ag45/Mut15]|uniref:Glyoxalase-like domain-containing protein n=1 Tax=Frankia umida TaxID=573489 RepID=A0ABT0K3N5_9ACTN|nr:hypothetical protein [Frankia umida]
MTARRSGGFRGAIAVGPRLFFQRVPEGKVAKNRLHPDVRVGPGPVGEERLATLEAECARLVALGAVRTRLPRLGDECSPQTRANAVLGLIRAAMARLDGTYTVHGLRRRPCPRRLRLSACDRPPAERHQRWTAPATSAVHPGDQRPHS